MSAENKGLECTMAYNNIMLVSKPCFYINFDNINLSLADLKKPALMFILA